MKKIFWINFHDNEKPLSETGDDLGEHKYNAYHALISVFYQQISF